MNKKSLLVALLVILALGSSAHANVFNLGPGLTSLETVPVGDVGNTSDTRYENPGYGRVNHSYCIGKFEVTVAQYTEFLNKVAETDTYGLYNSSMTSRIEREGSSGNYSYHARYDWANRPISCVTYWDTCRFANWLNNGQPSGSQNAATTEDGAYTLDGYTGSDGHEIGRNSGAKWFLPSEDEWYKSAYYKGGGMNSGYWDFATRSDAVPQNQIITPDPGNSANYYEPGSDTYTLGSPYHTTPVGTFGNSVSAYGTFDQSGNICEWNETVAWYGNGSSGRVIRGGSFSYSTGLNAGTRWDDSVADTVSTLGFRVAAVPEPSPVIALGGGFASVLLRRRRRQNVS
jgi:sulfatase modifying factor 1